MTKILTETPVFSANVVVPVAGEKVTAASVEVPLQSLANRTAYLEGQRFLNFAEGVPIPAEPATDIIFDVIYQPDEHLWFACGSETGVNGTVYMGSSWQEMIKRTVTSPPAFAFRCIGANSAVVVAPNPGAATIYVGTTRSVTALAAVTATNLGVGEDVLYVPSFGSSGRWIVCGEDSSNAPGVWTSDDDGTSWTQRTVPDVGSGQRPTSMAFGNGVVVMVCGRLGGTGQYWTSTDGITWSEDSEGVGALHSVTFNSVLGLFMMVDDEASLIYTSADGTTGWTTRTATTFATNGDWANVAAVGQYFVISTGELADPPGNEIYMSASVDSGVTWTDFLPFSNEVHHHATGNLPHRMRVTAGGRLVLHGYNATDGATVAVSMMGAVE
jgi:hypothetical protein